MQLYYQHLIIPVDIYGVVAVMWMATSVDTSAETHSVEDTSSLLFISVAFSVLLSWDGTGPEP